MTLPIVVGITGANGVVYGVELLKALKDLDASVLPSPGALRPDPPGRRPGP